MKKEIFKQTKLILFLISVFRLNCIVSILKRSKNFGPGRFGGVIAFSVFSQ